MISAVDSSVFLDVLFADPTHSAKSLELLEKARERGALIACPVVWGEVSSVFGDVKEVHRAFAEAGVRFDPFDEACSETAGAIWAEYRRNGGARSRLIPDFLVGAHALVRGATLVTRDRGFFRRYFSGLTVGS